MARIREHPYEPQSEEALRNASRVLVSVRARTEAPETSRQATILVVDDEPQLRRLARKMLESRGHRVVQAADGREGVARLREHRGRIDLVLLDLSMPGLGGAEALAELRAIDPGVRIVVCSGHPEEAVAIEIEADDLDGFLHKPYPLESLLAEVDRVLAD